MTNVNNCGGIGEREKILAWLSPLEPRIRHQDIEQRNIGIGSVAFAVENPVIRHCFATGIRESARPTSGKEPYPLRRKGVSKKL